MASKFLRWIGMIVFMVAVLVATPSKAATIFVNTTDDELTANGECSLREALRNANSNASIHGDCAAGSGNDTIQIQPGTIRLTIGGASEDNALTGDLDIRDTVTISGTPGGNTVVDVTVVADRVFHVIGSVEVQIDNLRITGGWSSQGSGLLMGSGAVLLFRADVVANTSTGGGGGLANLGGILQLDTVFMDSNTASTVGGGIQSSSNLTIANSLIQNNDAGSAGAIYMVGGQLQITNSDLVNNTASGFGGALLVTNSTASTSIVGGSFHFNEAPRGAAMQLNLPYSITGTTIRDNTATVDGALRSGPTERSPGRPSCATPAVPAGRSPTSWATWTSPTRPSPTMTRAVVARSTTRPMRP